MASTHSSRNGHGAHHFHAPAALIADTREPTQRPSRNMAAVTAQLRTSAEPVRRNIFTGAIEYYQEQQWRPLRDADLRSIAERLQNDSLPETTLATVRDVVALLADEQPHHPVRDDWLRQLPPWDDTKRIDHLLTDYLPCELPSAVLPYGLPPPVLAPDDPSDLMSPREAATRYYEILGRRWLLSCVARVMDPGCPIDIIPVLAGNVLKLTETIEMLVPRPWLRQVTALPPDITWDDAAQCLLGAWIHILPPFRHDRQRELGKFKAFLSAISDRTHRGMLPDRAPRQCAFIALREECDLIDQTGAPLFWPAVVDSERIDYRAIERDQAQLWAEAVAAHSRGETWLARRDMNVLAIAGQTCRLDDDLPICHNIEAWLATRPDPHAPFSLGELMNGINWFDGSKAEQMHLARVLREVLGYRKQRPWSGPRRGAMLWSRAGTIVAWRPRATAPTARSE